MVPLDTTTVVDGSVRYFGITVGADPERHPYLGLLAATTTGVFRASLTFWASSGGSVSLDHLIDLAFGALADGLPEHCELRYVTERDDREHIHEIEVASPTSRDCLRPSPPASGIRTRASWE